MVPAGVPAIIVDQVAPLSPLHSSKLLMGQPTSARRFNPWKPLAPARVIGCTPGKFEVSVLTHKGLVVVVSLVLALIRGPRRGVPNGAIDPHWP